MPTTSSMSHATFDTSDFPRMAHNRAVILRSMMDPYGNVLETLETNYC